MGCFVDQMKKRKRIEWRELHGIKIGFRILTINEASEYMRAVQDCDGDNEKMAELFATKCVDESERQAFSVDDIKECLTDADLSFLIDTFHEVNGMGQTPEETEKN